MRPDAPVIDAAIDAPDLPLTVAVTLTNRPAVATDYEFLVAYKDGDGPWTLAPAPTGDTYTVPVSSATYGLAWTCLSPGNREVNTFYFAKSERTSITIPIPDRCTDRAPVAVAVSGVVSNRPVAGAMAAAFGGRASDVNAGTGAYSIPTVPGTFDLFVGHAVIAGGNAAMDSTLIQRNTVVTTGATINVDYATAALTQTAPVTVVADAGARVNVRTQLHSAGGTSVRLVDASAAPYVTNGLAASQAAPGDVYNLQILVADDGQTAITQDWTSTATARTFVAPTPFGAATTTVTITTPYPLIRSTWAPYANTIGYSWSGTQTLTAGQCGGAACNVMWVTNVSPGYAGTTPENFMPDLSGLAGWSTDLQFVPGVAILGYVNAATSTAGASAFPLAPVAAAGTSRVFVAVDWIATP